MAISQNFEVPLGDTVSIPFAATNADGSPYDLTSAVLVLFVSAGLPDSGAYLLQKSSASGGGVSIVNPPTAGLANLNFLSTDRALIVNPGSYPFSVRDEAANKTLTRGLLNFSDHAGR